MWRENRFYNDNKPSVSTDTGDEILSAYLTPNCLVLATESDTVCGHSNHLHFSVGARLI